jgi:hypothetical protein
VPLRAPHPLRFDQDANAGRGTRYLVEAAGTRMELHLHFCTTFATLLLHFRPGSPETGSTELSWGASRSCSNCLYPLFNGE